MGDFEIGDFGRQPGPTQIGNVPGEHVERPYSAVLALQDACSPSKCLIDGVTRFQPDAQMTAARTNPYLKTALLTFIARPGQVQLLWELRQALRRRTVHVPSSLSFQSRAKMLDPRGSSIRSPRNDYPVKTMTKELVEEI